MKTFTKAVSVILIAVMCLSLFATSAYASGETFNLNGAPSSNSGNVFNLGGASDAGNSNSFSTNSGNTSNNDSFSNNNSNSNSNGFSLNNSSYDASNNNPSFTTQSNNDTKGDTSGDTKGSTLLSTPSLRSAGHKTFTPTTASITVTDTEAKNVQAYAVGFAGDTYTSFTYGLYSNGDYRQELPKTAYKIDDAIDAYNFGYFTLYASWLKTLAPGTYHFFGEAGLSVDNIIVVTVNAGSAEDFGPFSVNGSPYTQRASKESNLYVESVSVTGKFTPFTKFALIPQGASQGIFAENVYKEGTTYIAFSRDFLDGLAGGYYDIYGVTADNQQVKFGEVNIKASNGTFRVVGSPYKQFDSDASNQYEASVSVVANEATTNFAQFSGYTVAPQGSGSGVSANGSVNIVNNPQDTSKQPHITFSRAFLNGLKPGYYDIYGTASNGQVMLGSMNIQANNGTFSVSGSPYTQYASSNTNQYADSVVVVTNETGTNFNQFTGYSLAPQGSTSGVSATGYVNVTDNSTKITLSRNLLDGLTPGFYNIYGITSGGQQITLGSMEIKSNNGTFTVSGSPYTQYASSEANQYADSVFVVTNETGTNFTQFTGYSLAPQGSTSGTSATGYVNVTDNSTKITLSRNLLDGLTPGYYDIYGVTANGQQINLGSVDVQGSENNYTVNPSNYTQYASDKENQYEDTVFVSTEKGSFAQFSRYCVAPQNGGNSTYADSNVSVADDKKSMGFSRAFLDKLEGGNYTIYGVTAAGKQIKLGTMFITAGSITYTVEPSVYEQFASDDPNAYEYTVSVKTSRTNSFDQFKKFALISQNGGGSHYADGYVSAPDKATIKFSRTFLDGLEGGTYDIHGVDANGQMLKLGTVFIKAGNTGYTVNPTTYEQFVSNASSQYADTIFVKAEGTNTFAQFTRYKFAPQGSISGTYADGSVTTANDKRSIAFSRTFLDGLNAGYYDIYGVGSDGKEVKLGTVYIKLGDLAYRVTPSTYEQYATKSTEEYKDSVSVVATNKSTNFTQFSRYAFIPQGSGVTSYADGFVNVVNKPSDTKQAPYVTFSRTFLDGLAGGYYDVYGIATNGKQVKFGSVYIKAGSGDYVVNPDVYTQYSTDDPIKVTAKTADFSRFTRFAVISMGSSSGGAYADGYTSLNSKKTVLTFDKDFLDGLTPGYYDIYGVTSKGEQVKLGSMYIKASNGGYPDGKWDLWPDYTIPWTSGDDPLMFRSNLMALRQTYPRYTIVPRWGSGAGSIPNNMVDVNQFWDMGDGVFALGTNFLRSLPAGTYTLQVVDYKHLADCTNVVTFRIGSTLRPIDTDKHIIGSIKNLRFLCDEPVYEVYVGNIPLTYGEDYALSNGNKTITLSFEFLNKRSAGNTYTIKALTASGTYPSSTFQILSTAQGSASPRTGDESNLGLWAAFLLLSGAAVVVLVPKLRKHDF